MKIFWHPLVSELVTHMIMSYGVMARCVISWVTADWDLMFVKPGLTGGVRMVYGHEEGGVVFAFLTQGVPGGVSMRLSGHRQ